MRALLLALLVGCAWEPPTKAVRVACVELLDGGVACSRETKDCYITGETLSCPGWREAR